MMKTPMIALTALIAFGAPAAFAQATPLQEVDDATVIQPWNVTADQIDDLNVYNPQGIKLGEVEEVVGASTTEATYLVIDFSETATGDDQDRLVPFEELTYIDNTLTLPSDANMTAFQVYND